MLAMLERSLDKKSYVLFILLCQYVLLLMSPFDDYINDNWCAHYWGDSIKGYDAVVARKNAYYVAQK